MPIDSRPKYSKIPDKENTKEALDYTHKFYNNIPLPFVIIDQEYIIIEFNQQFIETFYYQRNEIIGKSIIDLVIPEDKIIFLNSIKKLNISENVFGIEFQMFKKDKSIVNVNFSAKISNKYTNTSLDIFCIIDVIPFRKVHENSHEVKKLELPSFLDYIGMHAWYLKDKETYGGANKTHADFFGYSKEYLENRNIHDFLPKEVSDKRIKDNIKVFCQKETIHVKEWATNKKGEKRLLRITKIPLINYEGKVEYIVCTALDVTDLKHAENTLKESQERIRCLFENSIDAIWASTKEGVIVEANQAAADMLGCDIKSLVGKNIIDFYVNPKDRLKFMEMVEKDNYVKNYEVKLKRENGSEIDCILSSTLWTNTFGEILGYIGIVHDITNLKIADKELINSKYFLQNTLDSLPDATFSIDLEGKIVSWNKKIEEMTGIKSQDMLGKGNHEYSLPFYRERRLALVDLILNAQEDLEMRYENLKKYRDVAEGEAIVFDSKGNKVIVWAKATALRDSNGNIIGAIESIRDITDIKLTESELNKVYIAIDQGPGIVVITDTIGNIEYVNQKFSEVTGYASNEVVGKNLRILKSNTTSLEFYLNFWDTLLSGSTWKGEFHNKKKNDESYWEYATISPVRNKKGEITNFIKVSEDITLKKKVEKQIDENIEYFAHLIDHIRNPLSILSGFIQIKVEEEETRKRLLRQIERIEEIMRTLDKGWMDTEDTKIFLKKYK
ncbi:MAG: Bacterioopsin transcriptional activator [Candidatus Methanofastidiosum methylothiophilum]|jgi:PAS domain S-box-containing protein|uniref:Bacterioopsin transcriptional activator n=1 Tax=Candidatus Methanofastidiosum methylothiophilum TaxID=1705564 RepID=A0A150JIK0_9EURY|nr:MAG: Bacterioopsin transcriptional activator [Candidatus Methanofastidiosum methylthiophilus]MBP6933089.1 PAS domain S-box protein [Methanofastidiosum sp.]OQC50385.1 MAG: Bacterioopsin transcriptional activator [Euryarchaeota archaeon ADurb.Bin023]KYC56490.1 MAG: Bacterioopsin transcriptional activator [Candidatus Methanofastidiosum methylthiophilus]KYC57082.1 MAG: Bacterioopsin transcriptional activator [Candidatus Methanofastidiosum methylthiophilus]